MSTFREYMENFVDMTGPGHEGARNKYWAPVLAKKILESERAINANLTRVEFRPGVCCEHRWIQGTLSEICLDCGATCTRDREGEIDWYDAEGGAPDVY